MRKAFCIGLLLLAPFAAQAAAPEELKPLFRSEKPYGQADFSYLWMDVYRISVWTDEPVWKPLSRYALSITYRMGFTAEELFARTCDEMQRHRADGKALCLGMRDVLVNAMPGVKGGDRITAIRTAEGETRFYKNGAPTGNVHDGAFTDAFFAIWLGANTSEPALRQQLVGQ